MFLESVLDFGLMIHLDDKRWKGLKGGYRVEYDPRPWLLRLEAGEDAEAAWKELWDGLHHQGDVGEASYAAVPHLVHIYNERSKADWNLYAIVAVIDLARDEKQNPAMPSWLADDYAVAIQYLATLGATQILQPVDSDTVRYILSVLALAKGARVYAKLLLDFSEDEVRDPESRIYESWMQT